jgi:hypothetical protein
LPWSGGALLNDAILRVDAGIIGMQYRLRNCQFLQRAERFLAFRQPEKPTQAAKSPGCEPKHAEHRGHQAPGRENREATARIPLIAKAIAQKIAPSNPTSGKLLAVFGNLGGCGASGVAGGFTLAVSTGRFGVITSRSGRSGLGGSVPVRRTSCVTVVSGISVTL